MAMVAARTVDDLQVLLLLLHEGNPAFFFIIDRDIEADFPKGVFSISLL